VDAWDVSGSTQLDALVLTYADSSEVETEFDSGDSVRLQPTLPIKFQQFRTEHKWHQNHLQRALKQRGFQNITNW